MVDQSETPTETRRPTATGTRMPRLAVEDVNAILDDIHEGYYEIDLLGNFTYTNPGFSRIIGYTRQELFNANSRIYHHYTDAANAQRIERTFAHVLRTGEPVRAVEAEITRKDGEKRLIELSVTLIRDGEGRRIGFRGLIRDVTARRRIDEALQQRIKMLTTLQQVDLELNHSLAIDNVLEIALNAASIVSNADAVCIAVKQGEDLNLVSAHGGYPSDHVFSLIDGIPARVIRQQAAEWIADVLRDPDYIPLIAETQAMIAAPFFAGERVQGVLLLETSEPDAFTEEIFDFARLLAARTASALDNALLYEASQEHLHELKKLYEQVSTLERLKTDMIRIASHDIRGPLAIVATYIDLLNDDLAPHLEPQHVMYINSIRSAVSRATQMTTDILSLERVQQRNRSPQAMTTVNLDDQLVHAINDQHNASALKRQTLVLNLDSDRPVIVNGSGDELGEAIINLVSNAIKYTPEGGTITATLTRADGRAVITITDSGYGIPQEAQPLLFEPFQRIQTQETRKIDGTGLGLYLVRRIIERHQGDIIFKSEYGTGSTFGFSLPLAETAPPSIDAE